MSAGLVPVIDEVRARVAHLFDTQADPIAIDAHLSANGFRRSVDALPGVRVPGAFDGFELAVRAVLGQQVTVKGASTLMTRLTNGMGESIDTDEAALTHLAPTAERLAAASVAEIRTIGLPNARAATLHALAQRVASGRLVLDAATDASELRRQLLELPGFGPWTADYITMRAARWSDAFPASDIALRHALGDVSAAEMTRRSDCWRPWRAYAAMRLWLHGAPGDRSISD